MTAAEETAAYQTILQKFQAAGIIAIIPLIPPSGEAPNNAANRLRSTTTNNWLRNNGGQYGAITIDITAGTLLAGSLTNQPNPAYVDAALVHFNTAGAFNVGQICTGLLDPIIPQYNIPWLYTYDAASGGVTGIYQSPTLNGSGGASVAPLTSGTITNYPNGWAAATNYTTDGTSGTIEARQKAALNPGRWLDYAVTFTAALKKAGIIQASASMGGKVVGDTVQFFAEMLVDPATVARLSGLYLTVTFVGASGNQNACQFTPGGANDSIALGTAIWSTRSVNDVLILGTQPVVIPAGTTAMRMEVGAVSASAGTLNFSIGSITVL